MAILKYENLSHSDLSALSREKSVVFLSVGPLEQHGPHMPLGTDALSARFFSEKIVKRLSGSRPDWNFILFPTIFAGCDTLTYTGTIEVRPVTLRALLLDCCKQLAKDGFRTIIAVGAHGGPRHMVVLEEVAAKMRWRYRTRMISASARILYQVLQGDFGEKIAAQMQKTGTLMTADERAALKGDYHGGLLETSLMLAADPSLVKPEYKTLQPAIVESYWKLRRHSGKTVGQGLGHLGTPALARAEIGNAAVNVLLDETEPLLERFLQGEDVYKLFRSKFYYIPFFRTHFKFLILLIICVFAYGIAWMILNRYLLEMYK